MTSYHKPYYIYSKKRKTSRTGVVWYYRPYKGDKLLTEKSTGCDTKTAAESYVKQLLQQGLLIPEASPKFGTFTTDFWTWGKSTYITSREFTAKPVGREHARNREVQLNNHLLPYLEDLCLHEITPELVREWLVKLRSAGLKMNTLKNCLANLRTIMHYAVDKGYIKSNPTQNITVPEAEVTPRGILTLSEVQNLFFMPDALDLLWGGSRYKLHYTASLLAMCTSKRQGEIRALTVDDCVLWQADQLAAYRPEHQKKYLRENYIVVAHGWGSLTGKKRTKTGHTGIIPLPVYAATALRDLIDTLPGPYVFSHTGERPIGGRVLTRQLHIALESMGVDWETRNIGFHSWRHYMASYLIGNGLSVDQVMGVTGHRSERMADNYISNRADWLQVLQAQEQMRAK